VHSHSGPFSRASLASRLVGQGVSGGGGSSALHNARAEREEKQQQQQQQQRGTRTKPGASRATSRIKPWGWPALPPATLQRLGMTQEMLQRSTTGDMIYYPKDPGAYLKGQGDLTRATVGHNMLFTMIQSILAQRLRTKFKSDMRDLGFTQRLLSVFRVYPEAELHTGEPERSTAIQSQVKLLRTRLAASQAIIFTCIPLKEYFRTVPFEATALLVRKYGAGSVEVTCVEDHIMKGFDCFQVQIHKKGPCVSGKTPPAQDLTLARSFERGLRPQ
jgi:hypothetical protein